MSQIKKVSNLNNPFKLVISHPDRSIYTYDKYKTGFIPQNFQISEIYQSNAKSAVNSRAFFQKPARLSEL